MSGFQSSRNLSDCSISAAHLLKDKYFTTDILLKAKTIPKISSLLSFAEVRTLKAKVRVYLLSCIILINSDIHAETEHSKTWLRSSCCRNPQDEEYFTVFITPGDVGTNVEHADFVFKHLTKNFDLVAYLPGNHESWSKSSKAQDSVEKLAAIFKCAQNNGVFIGPVRISYDIMEENNGLCLFPIQGWYHSSWDREPNVQHPMHLAIEEAIPFNSKWVDFSLCQWPAELIEPEKFSDNKPDATELAEAFGKLNERFLYPLPSASSSDQFFPESIEDLQQFLGSPYCQSNDTIISYSHYLPRQELSPEKRFLIEPLLSQVIGSDIIESQIRRLQPDLHVFGHLHVPIDLVLEGIRYIQWPLGYYRESTQQCKATYSSGPLLVFDSTLGTRKDGVPKDCPAKHSYWTEYYSSNARNPLEVMELGPWVLDRMKMYSGFINNE